MILLLLLLSLQTQALTFSEPALDDQWRSVVQITTVGLDSDNFEVNSYCVATFLSPQVLITAAHCVSHAYLLNSNEIKIDLGQYEYRKRPDGTTFRLGYIVNRKLNLQAKYYFTQNLTNKLKSQKFKAKIAPTEDMALVVLSESIDEQLITFTPLKDNEIKAIKNRIQEYVPTVVTINFISEMSLDTKRAASLDEFKSAGNLSWTSKSRSRLDPGDSGSPLFIRTGQNWKLIGVSKGQAKTLFSDWDVFTSVESNLCVIATINKIPICN